MTAKNDRIAAEVKFRFSKRLERFSCYILSDILLEPAATMTIPSTAPLSESDYCSIEDALQSSEKGRRFLRAYVDRNRGLEALRLLRSISRLHRAALGTPGPNGEICRDLSAMFKSVSRYRQAASQCDNDAARSHTLANGLEEIEASLLALIESLEEKAWESFDDSIPESPSLSSNEVNSGDRTSKLYGELSSYFSAEPR
jgi:hypothetical protein